MFSIPATTVHFFTDSIKPGKQWKVQAAACALDSAIFLTIFVIGILAFTGQASPINSQMGLAMSAAAGPLFGAALGAGIVLTVLLKYRPSTHTASIFQKRPDPDFSELYAKFT